MKNREVIEKILAYHPSTPGYEGCDEFKTGDPEAECTGIVCALSPNIHVLKETIRLGANLLIVHEPTFYTSADQGGWYEDFDNEVYEEKRKLIDDHGITIWRDHDHMHMHDPDSIFTGVLKYMGWEDRAVCDRDTGMFAHYLVDLEPVKLKDLLNEITEKIGLNGLRYIGDPEMTVTRIALVGHLYPMYFKDKNGRDVEYSVNVIKTLEQKADVIMPGEVIDWTTLSYVRDAVELGKKKAVINIGHFNWEELGMKYYKDWLPGLLEEEISVTYVPSKDMYHYLDKEGERR